MLAKQTAQIVASSKQHQLLLVAVASLSSTRTTPMHCCMAKKKLVFLGSGSMSCAQHRSSTPPPIPAENISVEEREREDGTRPSRARADCFHTHCRMCAELCKRVRASANEWSCHARERVETLIEGGLEGKRQMYKKLGDLTTPTTLHL